MLRHDDSSRPDIYLCEMYSSVLYLDGVLRRTIFFLILFAVEVQSLPCQAITFSIHLYLHKCFSPFFSLERVYLVSV